ncbi:uncharacterized protein LOC128267412 [Anopheles cruzii]|uniref:uncharacterized protein LOC128267412 n=1 Tax=Anopheles cruzii TaxID=68878 RepID=UPI0022EC31AE|nr:uncharacterized protein LOC128267412 [Anopheles cruzii]
MGSCTRRHFLLSICFLQLLFITERQVFDFLGYMWAPILVNFFQILFVIFGIFGACQYRPRYLVAYSLWSLLWLGWNIFLICFYLNVGILDRDSDLLNLGTGSVSWFEENGYGCRPTYPTNVTSEDPYRPVRPEKVEGCLLEYHIVEVVHSGVHAALAVFGIFGAICLGHTFLDEDDSCKNSKKGAKHRQSLYSVEFSRPVDTIRGAHPNSGYDDDELIAGGTGLGVPSSLSPKPMTPRRVKRRSVMQRGATAGSSIRQSSRRVAAAAAAAASLAAAGAAATGGSAHHHHHRSSTRASRRKMMHQNPVTKLLNQQQQQQHQQHHHHHHHHRHGGGVTGGGGTVMDDAGTMTLTKTFPPFVHNKNPDLTESNLKSLNNDYILGQFNNFGSGVIDGVNTVASNNLNTFSGHQQQQQQQQQPVQLQQQLQLQQQQQQLLLQQQQLPLPLPPHRHPIHTPPTLPPPPDGTSPIDPIYYNMNSSSPLLQQQTSWASAHAAQQAVATASTGFYGGVGGGLSNPVYQHSNANLANHSPELNEEYYGTNGNPNRPPSVRSSYSNFHGTRPLSSYHLTAGGGVGGPTGGITNRGYSGSPPGGLPPPVAAGGTMVENVFASLTTPAVASGQVTAATVSSDPMAVPQLPSRRSVSRESVRAMQFLNSGPPAYNLNYHTPPDSETTM